MNNLCWSPQFLWLLIFEFGNTSPVHPNEDKAALKVALLIEQTEKQTPPVQKIKAPVDYDLQRTAANAAAIVYGWLPAEKQPKKIKDQEAPKSVPNPPPKDILTENVKRKIRPKNNKKAATGLPPIFAAHAVYGWLPKKPKLMDDDERASALSALNV
uniref:Uncharacterized protein n=1 Tax=Globodera pallida TaxID=36090 RepID=A0A183C1D2_GLOPA